MFKIYKNSKSTMNFKLAMNKILSGALTSEMEDQRIKKKLNDKRFAHESHMMKALKSALSKKLRAASAD